MTSVLSATEMAAQVFITALTNFAMVPTLILLLRHRRMFECVLGFFTMWMSFLYHYCDTVGQGFWLSTGAWHRLDNIGSIACFCAFFIYAMANTSRDLDLILKLTFLCITLILQEKAPWDERFTVYPILVAAALPVFKWVVIKRRWPPYHTAATKRGLVMLGMAIVCFVKGLDERQDYLRLWHGSWHMMLSFAFFHLWQLIPGGGKNSSVTSSLSKKDLSYHIT